MSIALAFCPTANAQQADLLDKVNLYIGTADDYGQMTPGATVPYSQIQVCPDSKPRQHPGYDYEQSTISGFSINRLSGVGGSGCGGNVSLITAYGSRRLPTAAWPWSVSPSPTPSRPSCCSTPLLPSTRSMRHGSSRSRPRWDKAMLSAPTPADADAIASTTVSTPVRLSCSTRLPTAASVSPSPSCRHDMLKCVSSSLPALPTSWTRCRSRQYGARTSFRWWNALKGSGNGCSRRSRWKAERLTSRPSSIHLYIGRSTARSRSQTGT